ncbi:2Fe-2S iron-sulfur cluster-binding protein [Pelagicoccus sp. SDUM812003]|uniref:2Fe-2S iron-sulfur cluster-binding protein n=1 Tax=Pelagicoccus sp. SDUM812003 TaxID=3041267 RepID=UPI00280CBF2A|nr:2Fe-2S iron-sulfur cluster-binding protein [Pelagicoccus sp. SDUM812003]MDQ8201455.1 2Fe-2S iron-sulfur cluster-binding protein [Pelagicoccus sp. SDUM812003]
MPKVTFITQDKEAVVVDNVEGSLMEIAVDHGIEGIEGDCGGVCSCSTCHVLVAREWMDKVGQPEDIEKDTLEFNPDVTPRSRLCCQIELTKNLDGLVVEVPSTL